MKHKYHKVMLFQKFLNPAFLLMASKGQLFWFLKVINVYATLRKQPPAPWINDLSKHFEDDSGLSSLKSC